MLLGNIVSTQELKIQGYFNVVDSLDKIIQGIPTLIVGWKFIKDKFPNYNITERKLDSLTYWTFNKTERRDIFNDDLDSFTQECYNRLISNVKYIYVDPIQDTKSRIYKILRKIYKSNRIFAYRHEDMVYLSIDDLIFGIDLKILSFIGFNTDKIIAKIKSISTAFLIDDDILIEYKNHIDNLDDQVKYTPFLYSINE